jgi:GntR family transcriptional regulator
VVPTSDYRRIVNDLAALITSGKLKPGEKLRSRSKLAEYYKVSISTVDRAMTVLHDRELVYGHQGKGTFVAGPADTPEPEPPETSPNRPAA